MKLSLITVCRNSELTILDTLDSISLQKGKINIEHVVQDGASSDRTLDYLNQYKNASKYPVSIHSKSDCGFYDGLNRALDRSSGDVLGLLNSDDTFAYERALCEIVDVFNKNPEIEIVYGDLNYVRQCHESEDSRVVHSDWVTNGDLGGKNEFYNRKGCPPRVVRKWKAGLFTRSKFRCGWMPPHPTVYIRREVFERVGGYRLDFGSAADYEWLLRVFYGNRMLGMRERGTIYYVPKVLVNMGVGGQSNSSLRNRLAANRLDRRAWSVSGVKPCFGFSLLKPMRKLSQWF